MGIYDNEKVRYLNIYCGNCQYNGQIIDVFDGTNAIFCPNCKQRIDQIRSLDLDSCQEGL